MSRRIRDYLWPCWVDKGQLAHHCQARPSQLIAPIWAQAQCPFCAVKVLGQAVTSPGPTATPPPPAFPAGPPITTKWLSRQDAWRPLPVRGAEPAVHG